MRFILRSKIHQAVVTGASVDYMGSIAIDLDLVERAGFMAGEEVLVVSNTSGARLETYIIEAPRGSGTIEMSGAAAHLIQQGETASLRPPPRVTPTPALPGDPCAPRGGPGRAT